MAAPVVLGAAALRSAKRLGIPSVAIFQTDLAGFAKRHGLGTLGPRIWNYLASVHSMADVTLAPNGEVIVGFVGRLARENKWNALHP